MFQICNLSNQSKEMRMFGAVLRRGNKMCQTYYKHSPRISNHVRLASTCNKTDMSCVHSSNLSNNSSNEVDEDFLLDVVLLLAKLKVSQEPEVQFSAPKREYQPKLIKRKRRHGFLKRVSTKHGINMLKRRIQKGRRRLSKS